MVGSHASRIGGRDPEFIQLAGNPLDAFASGTPLQHCHPDAQLLQVVGQDPHVVTRAPNRLSVLEPLDETVVGIDQGSGKSVRCSPAGAVTLRRHRGLDENHAIAEPRRELAVLLILDEAGDQVGHFIGLHVFGREHPVVSPVPLVVTISKSTPSGEKAQAFPGEPLADVMAESLAPRYSDRKKTELRVAPVEGKTVVADFALTSEEK